MIGYVPRFGVIEIIFSLIFGMIIIGLVIFSVVKILESIERKDIDGKFTSKKKNGAMEILRERYAKDIISEEEYIHKKKTLERDD